MEHLPGRWERPVVVGDFFRGDTGVLAVVAAGFASVAGSGSSFAALDVSSCISCLVCVRGSVGTTSLGAIADTGVTCNGFAGAMCSGSAEATCSELAGAEAGAGSAGAG